MEVYEVKKRRNSIIFLLVSIIIAGGTALYRSYFNNIDSDHYLSSNVLEKSVEEHQNDKMGKNSRSFDFKKFDGQWSLIQFTSNKSNKINIVDNTKINSGKFYIVVLDSKNNIVAKKNELKDKGNISFTTPKDGKYAIKIAGSGASGNFDISVNASNNIDISHKDFFDE